MQQTIKYVVQQFVFCKLFPIKLKPLNSKAAEPIDRNEIVEPNKVLSYEDEIVDQTESIDDKCDESKDDTETIVEKLEQFIAETEVLQAAESEKSKEDAVDRIALIDRTGISCCCFVVVAENFHSTEL
jgi:hypothetical protein